MALELCQYCRRIAIERLESDYEYGPTFEELNALRNECGLCQLIYEAIPDPSTHHKTAKVVLRFAGREDLQQLNDLVNSASHENAHAKPLQPLQYIACTAHLVKTSHELSETSQALRPGLIRVFATEACAPAVLKILPGRPIHRPDSRQATACYRRWLSTCLNTHQRCRTALSGEAINESPILPTRVIDVTAAPRIVVSNGQSARYLALSYCWGPALRSSSSLPNFLLTSQSLTAFEQALPLDILPKTIQDAILVTKRLGFAYLWVDSICILQDSAEDWFQESSRMGRIFQSATCTIAATAAENSSEGLFTRAYADVSNANAETPAGSFLSIPCMHHGQYLGQMCVARMTGKPPPWSPIKSFNEEMSQSSWNHRAWVVQERLLSRRIIHFGQTQTFFECQDGCWSESLPGNDSASMHADLQSKRAILSRLGRESTLANRLTASSQDLRTFRAYAYSSYDKIQDLLSLAPWDNVEDPRQRFWSRVVRYYNITDITRRSDKLVAILGLAKMLEARLCLTYCAGIWVEDIARSLFWWTDAADSGPLYHLAGSGAPTWSWAAWQGSIRFATFVSEYDNARPRVLEHYDKSQNPKITRTMIKVAAHGWAATISHADIGMVRNEGWKAKAFWTPEAFVEPLVPFDADERLEYALSVPREDSRNEPSYGMLQCDDLWFDPQEGQQCFCLVLNSTPIFKNDASEPDSMPIVWAFGYYLLILQPSRDVPGAYVRIGVGVCVSADDRLPYRWFRHATPSEAYTLV